MTRKQALAIITADAFENGGSAGKVGIRAYVETRNVSRKAFNDAVYAAQRMLAKKRAESTS